MYGIGYGAQGVLYFLCTRYLWNQRKARRTNVFMLAYITLLFLISSVAQVALAHRMQLVFIENRNFPGGPWGHHLASARGTLNIVGQAANVVLVFLSELFMVWRCWVVWYSVGRYTAYAVALFPLLVILAFLIAAILDFFSIVHPTSVVAGAHATVWTITHYTLGFSTNVAATAPIPARLIAHRRFVQKSLMHAHAMDYTSLITIIIESSSLYSMVGAACLIVSGVGLPVSNAFVSAAISMQQISGFLIIIRLANGRALDASALSSKFVAQRAASMSDTKMSDEEQGTTGSI